MKDYRGEVSAPIIFANKVSGNHLFKEISRVAYGMTNWSLIQEAG